MATYNGEKHLREQVNSILEQTIQDFELIVCDDCSTDNTWNILQEYQSLDKRIKCYRNEENLGFKNNFEKAIKLCIGDYIALSDQDDIWLPNHIEILLKNISSYDLIGANAQIISSNDEVKKTLTICSECFNSIPKDRLDYFHLLCHRNIFRGCTTMFRRDLVCFLLPFPECVVYHDYWIAFMASLHNGVVFIPDIVSYYRSHSESCTYSVSFSFNNFFNLKFRKKIKLHHERNLKFLEYICTIVPNDDVYKTVLMSAINFEKRKFSLSNLLNLKYFFSNYELIYMRKPSLKNLLKSLIKSFLYN